MGPWRIPACAELFKSVVAASRRAKETGKERERVRERQKVRECRMKGSGCRRRERVDGEEAVQKW